MKFLRKIRFIMLSNGVKRAEYLQRKNILKYMGKIVYFNHIKFQ